MHKTLKELWQGDLASCTKPFKHDADYEKALKIMFKNEETLNATLEGNEKEAFEKFCDCRDKVEYYTEEDTFITGFRLGARIIIESLC